MRAYLQVVAAAVLSTLIAFSLPAVGQTPADGGSIESKFATVDGIKIHYLTAGHGPAVILFQFVEVFLVHSWAEHLRQHERQTKADSELEQRVYSYVAGEPKVRHLLYADRKL